MTADLTKASFVVPLQVVNEECVINDGAEFRKGVIGRDGKIVIV